MVIPAFDSPREMCGATKTREERGGECDVEMKEGFTMRPIVVSYIGLPLCTNMDILFSLGHSLI